MRKEFSKHLIALTKVDCCNDLSFVLEMVSHDKTLTDTEVDMLVSIIEIFKIAYQNKKVARQEG